MQKSYTNWYKVKAWHEGKSYTGYVAKSKTKLYTVSSSKTIKFYINKNNLPLKKKASSVAKTLKKLPLGSTVTATGSQGEWFKVKTPDGTVGYIEGLYAKRVKPTSSVQTTPTPTPIPQPTEKPMQIPSVTTFKSIGFVDYAYLNLRYEPSATSQLVHQLRKNDLLFIESTKNGWHRVVALSYGTFQLERWVGYVSMDYVKIIKPFLPSYHIGCVNYNYLNLRKSPSTSATLVEVLDRDDQLILEAYADYWWKVSVVKNDKVLSGYVHADYVKVLE